MVKGETAVTYKCVGTESSKISTLTFNKQKSLKAVHFQIDNTPAALYLVKMWGFEVQTLLIKLSKEISQYLLKHQITVIVEYLPSSLNVEADWQSENSRD